MNDKKIPDNDIKKALFKEKQEIKECIEKVKAEVESWTYNFECYSDKRKALERLEKYFEEMVGDEDVRL